MTYVCDYDCVFQHYLKTKNNRVNIPTHVSDYYVTQLANICTKITYLYHEGTDVLLIWLCFVQMLIPQEAVGPIKLYVHKPMAPNATLRTGGGTESQ